MIHKIFHSHTFIIVVLYGILAVFLVAFNPYSMPAPLLFVPFLLFFAATFLLTYRLLVFITKKLHLGMGKHHAARISFVVSGLPTFLVLLQSIGQVGGYDIIISIVLFGAIDFYLARSRFGIFQTNR